MRNQRRLLWLLMGLFPLAAVAGAQTPLEKAMQALAMQDRQQASSPTAFASVSFTNQAAAMAGVNTPAAASLPANPLLVAFPVTPTAAAFWPAGITPTAKTGIPSAVVADPMALTASASYEDIQLTWANTITATATPANTATAFASPFHNTRTAWGAVSAANWQGVSGMVGYVVSRSETGEKALKPLWGMPQTASYYRDVSATAKNNYWYQVQAVDAQGQTLAGSLVIRAQLKPSLLPDTPAGVAINSENERTHITWPAVNPTSHAIGGYVIYRTPATGGEAVALHTKGKDAIKPEFNDETGIVGTEYQYKVAAIDAWGTTGEASLAVSGHARPRDRNGLVLMSTAYRGLGLTNTGLNGDLQFMYFIGTLYGEESPRLSSQSLYLDPISLWLLSADAKYTFLTEADSPATLAAGGKASLQLFAGQQSAAGGSFSFSGKSNFQTLWGIYLAASRTWGGLGVHGGYCLGTEGNVLYYLSKFMEPAGTNGLLYLGFDFPIVRRMNAAIEIMYPVDGGFQSRQHPLLINTHVDRFLNFDISFLHWDEGWAFLGCFNLRFTIFPGSER